MQVQNFNALVSNRLKVVEATLVKKAQEYSGITKKNSDDRLHNFKIAGRFLDDTPKRALYGMLMKHLISFDDMINGNTPITQALLDDKITDIIAYMLLAEGLMVEELELTEKIKVMQEAVKGDITIVIPPAKSVPPVNKSSSFRGSVQLSATKKPEVKKPEVKKTGKK